MILYLLTGIVGLFLVVALALLVRAGLRKHDPRSIFRR